MYIFLMSWLWRHSIWIMQGLQKAMAITLPGGSLRMNLMIRRKDFYPGEPFLPKTFQNCMIQNLRMLRSTLDIAGIKTGLLSIRLSEKPILNIQVMTKRKNIHGQNPQGSKTSLWRSERFRECSLHMSPDNLQPKN